MSGSLRRPRWHSYSYHQEIQRNTRITMLHIVCKNTYNIQYMLNIKFSIALAIWEGVSKPRIRRLCHLHDKGCCLTNGAPTTEITTVQHWILYKQRGLKRSNPPGDEGVFVGVKKPPVSLSHQQGLLPSCMGTILLNTNVNSGACLGSRSLSPICLHQIWFKS